MIGSTWMHLRSIALEGGMDADLAGRIANLTLAAALSNRADTDLTARELHVAVSDLARHPLPDRRIASRRWNALREGLYATPLVELTPAEIDEWTEAFQCAGNSRKELGAFATPSVFARRLASDTLEGDPRAWQTARIIDPSCGAGALLIACLDELAPRPGSDRERAVGQLHGVELDPTARELCCLLLWLSAGIGSSLNSISSNIVVGNAITRDWWCPEDPYDVLVMNPPWESLRHKAATADAERERASTAGRLAEVLPGRPELPPLFTAHGRGDRNLAKAFLELAPHLLYENGRIGMLIPAAFASDDGMAELRRRYLEQFALERWTSFENRAKHFSIDSRYKFGILVGTRSAGGTDRLRIRSFAVNPEETGAPHVSLSRADLRRVGGPGAMILELSSARELSLLETMVDSGIPFSDGGRLGNCVYKREVDLSLGRAKGQFESLGDRAVQWDGDQMIVGNARVVPVVEGRMVGQYDCFQKSWVSGTGRSAVWRNNGTAALHDCQPQYIARPTEGKDARVVICDVTSSTNTRTMLATMVPDTWVCGNTAPTLVFRDQRSALAAMAVLNSMVFDWMTRRIVAGLHLNKFYLDCLAWPSLTEEDVDKLALASQAFANTMFRVADTSKLQMQTDISGSEARAQVEALVAARFQLNSEDLRFMFDADPMHRRGFWRYFDADADALKIASRSIALLSNSEQRRSVGAAVQHKRTRTDTEHHIVAKLAALA